MNISKKNLAPLPLVLFPVAALAQAPEDFRDFVEIFLNILNIVASILLSLAFIYFVWGLAVFVLRVGGDEKAVTEGKQKMVWGLIALFVMTTLWAIVTLVAGEFDWANGGILPFLGTPS